MFCAWRYAHSDDAEYEFMTIMVCKILELYTWYRYSDFNLDLLFCK